MRCASVRKKGSDIQCPAKPLFGHTLCGRHAKCKNPILWSTTQHENIHHVIKLQSCIRGWLLRKRLALAGPGVLRRKEVSNDEDFNTMNEKEKVHPMDYFGFEEHGKIWWFEVKSIFQWTTMSFNILNPYTNFQFNNTITVYTAPTETIANLIRPAGSIVFNTNTNTFLGYNGSHWVSLG